MSRIRSESPEVELQAFDDADAQATFDVFRRAVRITAAAHYSSEQIDAWCPADLDADPGFVGRWRERRASVRTRVARLDGRVVGFTDVDDRGYIDMMFVDPEAAGRGVASALLADVERHCLDHAIPLLTTNASLAAQPFFARRGFTMVAEQWPVVRGIELLNARMERPLLADGERTRSS